MFKITCKSGQYKVWMRAGLSSIRSERKLRESLQRSITAYSQKPGWERYAERCQELLDQNDILRLAGDWGFFSKKIKIEK